MSARSGGDRSRRLWRRRCYLHPTANARSHSDAHASSYRNANTNAGPYCNADTHSHARVKPYTDAGGHPWATSCANDSTCSSRGGASAVRSRHGWGGLLPL